MIAGWKLIIREDAQEKNSKKLLNPPSTRFTLAEHRPMDQATTISAHSSHHFHCDSGPSPSLLLDFALVDMHDG